MLSETGPLRAGTGTGRRAISCVVEGHPLAAVVRARFDCLTDGAGETASSPTPSPQYSTKYQCSASRRGRKLPIKLPAAPEKDKDAVYGRAMELSIGSEENLNLVSNLSDPFRLGRRRHHPREEQEQHVSIREASLSVRMVGRGDTVCTKPIACMHAAHLPVGPCITGSGLSNVLPSAQTV